MNKKVLICDDDDGILDVLRIIIENLGYEVVTLSNCKKIFEIINKIQPRLLLLDLWMPDISGEEVTRQLKADPVTRKIPIVILSAARDTEEKARLSGADSFICKPFDIDLLEKKIKEYLR